MDNLKINAQDSLLKSVGIAFPNARLRGVVPGAFLKFSVKEIDKIGFRNLKTISLFYKQEVEIATGTNYMTITMTEKEVEDEH